VSKCQMVPADSLRDKANVTGRWLLSLTFSVMPDVPFHLHYTLSRGQRIVPHIRIWGIAFSPFILGLFGFFVVAAVFNFWQFRLWDGFGFLLFAGLLFILVRGFFVGIIEVLTTGRREVDLLVENEAAGVLLRGQRWWLFLDGFVEVRKYHRDVWTLRHHNGAVLNIPTAEISLRQLDHIRAAMERGRTPEGVRAVIERGGRITEILNEKKQA